MVWLRPLALAAGALMLAIPLAPTLPAVSALLFFVAGIASVWAFTVGDGPRFRTRDPYDLGELRRVHHEEEIRALDDEGALGDPEKAVCPHCFTEYGHRLGSCPNCGRRG